METGRRRSPPQPSRKCPVPPPQTARRGGGRLTPVRRPGERSPRPNRRDESNDLSGEADLGAGWGRCVLKKWGKGNTVLRFLYAPTPFAFHDGEEIGPKMLSRIAKYTGLEPSDL
ncbi:hypothetical protein CCR95_06805 [Thiocystis minor]|nr:hypothetical protein [Thiocystis minor]